jgi:ferredoxin
MARVWIETGCIQCFWCQNLNAVVFEVTADGCRIRGEALVTGTPSDNREDRAELRPDLLPQEDADFLPFLAGGCPTQVIKLEGLAAIDDPLHVLDPR